jgi:hypothetical protein
MKKQRWRKSSLIIGLMIRKTSPLTNLTYLGQGSHSGPDTSTSHAPSIYSPLVARRVDMARNGRSRFSICLGKSRKKFFNFPGLL